MEFLDRKSIEHVCDVLNDPEGHFIREEMQPLLEHLKGILYEKIGYPAKADMTSLETDTGLVNWQRFDIHNYDDDIVRSMQSLFTWNITTLLNGYQMYRYMKEKQLSIYEFLRDLEPEELLSEMEGYPEYEYLSSDILNMLENTLMEDELEEAYSSIVEVLEEYAVAGEWLRCFFTGETLDPKLCGYWRNMYLSLDEYFNTCLMDLDKKHGLSVEVLRAGVLEVLLYFLAVPHTEFPYGIGEGYRFIEYELDFSAYEMLKKYPNYPYKEELQFLFSKLENPLTITHFDSMRTLIDESDEFEDFDSAYQACFSIGEHKRAYVILGSSICSFVDSTFLVTSLFDRYVKEALALVQKENVA